MYLHSR
jgi:hypothetical protein